MKSRKKPNNDNSEDLIIDGMSTNLRAIPATEYSQKAYAIERFGKLLGHTFQDKNEALIVQKWLTSIKYDITDNGDIEFY